MNTMPLRLLKILSLSKGFFAAGLLLTILDINTNFLPKPDMLIVMGIAIVVDFLTGVAKSFILHEKRDSERYRKTIAKFIQYGGAILIGMGISFLGTKVETYNKSWAHISDYMSWLNSGLIIFIILIEITSILENLYAINKTSPFSKYAVLPVLKILTIEIKNNPFTKLTVEFEDGKKEIKPEDINVKVEEKPIEKK